MQIPGGSTPGRWTATASFEEAPSPPDRKALAALLDRFAPLTPAPLVPEVCVFHARDLVEVWQAAEQLAGAPLPAPFWAYPWPAGSALARVLLDRPELVRGRAVLDLGAGGGVAALAASRAGAREVLANDVDPWAITVCGLAAERQGVALELILTDFTSADRPLPPVDVVLCADLAYERRKAPRQRALLERARRGGADVLVADAGRAYFDDSGLVPLASYELVVPRDLEGTDRRTAIVYRWA